MAIFSDLMLRLRANSADLQTGSDKAKSSIKKIDKAAQELGKTFKGAFSDGIDAIDKIIPGFAGFTSGISKAISTVTTFSGSLKILKVALIGTGIGAIVVALGSLISYFKNTERGADAFAKVLNGIKSVISAVTRRLSFLGEAIVKLLKGDFKGAAEAAKNAFKDLGDEIKSTYKAGLELEERRDKLEDDRIAFLTREQALNNKIAKAKEIINAEDVSNLEKQLAINEAAKASAELYETKTKFAKEEADILIQQNALGDNLAEDNKAEEEAKVRILQLEEERSREMKFINSMQKKLNNEISKEEQAQAKILSDLKEQNTLKAVQFLPSLTAKVDTTQLAGTSTVFKEITNELAAFPSIIGNIEGVFTGFFMNIGQGFKGLAKAFGDMLKQMLAQMLAKSAIFLLLSFLSGGTFGVGKLATGAAGMLNAGGGTFSKFLGFADGGIAYGPTLGLVGEYAGAKTDPEVIAPLSKLSGILGNQPIQITIKGKFDGRDISLAVDEAKRVKNNSY